MLSRNVSKKLSNDATYDPGRTKTSFTPRLRSGNRQPELVMETQECGKFSDGEDTILSVR